LKYILPSVFDTPAPFANQFHEANVVPLLFKLPASEPTAKPSLSKEVTTYKVCSALVVLVMLKVLLHL
jgi:hypothetical protein